MRNLKRLFIALLTNPLFIIGYWIFCYELALLCMYGRVHNHVAILLISTVFLISLIIFTTIKLVKNKEIEHKKTTKFKIWKYISIVIIVILTLFYGLKIYKSATNLGGELAWLIHKIKNEASVTFEHDNIYKDGIEGIFKDINNAYTLPKKLYMESDFQLEFNADGTITSFDTFVYGENADGKEDSFLITYDKKKSKKMTLILNGYVGADHNEAKRLQPLIETVKVIPLKQTVSKWNEQKYGLVYYGKRNWSSNTAGIININEDGVEQTLERASSDIIGYTVSIFVPGKENEILPARYHLIGNPKWSQSTTTQDEEGEEGKQQEQVNDNEQFFLAKKVGYRLNVTDKALGSTLYSLSKTIDGGETWDIINQNPFNGTVGSAEGITFMNEKLGFLRAARPSGAEGMLYRTDDGGLSFKEVSYNTLEKKLENGQTIIPFDFPGLPYEEDGVFTMVVGQGADGDYNGNSNALYQSTDNGETWEYIKEVENQ